jgi:hypothetical protein
MAVWTCAECTADYAVGLPKCPQCGSTIRVDERPLPPEEETDMAKVTVHGGASDAIADELKAGEDVSAGTSSSTSSETQQPSSEPSGKQGQSPARSTGSRSGRNRAEGDSSARRTATGGRKTAGDHSAD